MDCPQHKVVSLTGNISPDGSAAFYNVIFTMADRIKARSFPMPLPVIASSPQEREMLLSQPMIQPTLALAARGRRHLRRHRRPRPEGAALRGRLHHRSELKALQKAGGGRRDRRLGLRPRRPADRRHHQRSRRLGAAAVARALAGDRARHGRQEAARHPGGGDAPAGQRADHRRAHGLRAACGVSRFRKSVSRFSDRNLRQNKRLSRRSVGEATQVCLAIWPSPAPNISGRPRDRRYRQARSG